MPRFPLLPVTQDSRADCRLASRMLLIIGMLLGSLFEGRGGGFSTLAQTSTGHRADRPKIKSGMKIAEKDPPRAQTMF